ncbi:MAG: DPP IV N-terminal domain-containing protein [Planctomycetota bacterium]|nr:DPP IV N-terminal domain-containing protein [Planctomycetota bacterium]
MHTRTMSNFTAPGLVLLSALICTPVIAQERVTKANYKLAHKYSSSFLRQFTYSTSVSPSWIGKSERFWYSFRTSSGTKYWLVDANARTKHPLFDHAKVAAGVSSATGKAVDATKLSLSSLKVSKDEKKLTFASGGWAFEYDFASGSIKKTGKARRTSSRSRSRRGSSRGTTREEMTRRFRDRQREQEDDKKDEEKKDEEKKDGEKKDGEEQTRTNRDTRDRGSRSGTRGSTSRTRSTTSSDGRSYSPDKKVVVFAKDHNLYILEGKLAPVQIAKADQKPTKKVANASISKTKTKDQKKVSGKQVANASISKAKEQKKTSGKQIAGNKGKAVEAAAAKSTTKKAAPPSPKYLYDDKVAVQLTKDGVDGFGFGGALQTSTSNSRTSRSTRTSTRGTSRTGSSRTRRPSRSRMARVSWSPNSAAFYTTRRDSRHSKELFLVNSIAEPRPSLQTYRYSMPGEEGIRTVELHYYEKGNGKLVMLPKKWKDESYSSMTWLKDRPALRFTRRDRAMRKMEISELDPKTGKVTVLLVEGSEDGHLKSQSKRSLSKSKEFIWWSERSGWGHYYLYGEDYKLKNAITSGAFRASRIVSVDETLGVMYFRANGREGGNVYDEHLYRVRLDGSGLTLLDPGPGSHRSSLSPSKRYLVDNATAVDMAPTAVLRDTRGNEVMKLEETDLSMLKKVGWKMPSTFTVKAADGVTNLFGNMWKPFDFDANKKYPIIVNVYPGPQMEGVSRSFSASSSRQQLAQLGFIVIQVGHRGGTPKRSRAYANYGYYNLRDYGLADKKAAIEQLGMRHSFIDVDRVGIFGHSGGGFMTAAALLQKPYNEFFTAGIASSGNHDNNIYNSSWSERYHGLKEVAVEDKKKEEGAGSTGGDSTRARRGGDSGGSRRQNSGRRTENNSNSSTGTTTVKKTDSKKTDVKKTDVKKTDAKKADAKKADAKKADVKKTEKKTKFEIHVPTNAELAENLVGNLLLVHGEIDNNVHPANTMRLVDALIKANKRFDMLIVPGARHGFGRAGSYVTQRGWEFWAEHLLGERQVGADITKKGK